MSVSGRPSALPYAHQSILDTWTQTQSRDRDVKGLKLTSTVIEDMWKGRLRCRYQCRCGYHACIGSTCWRLRRTSNISYAVKKSTGRSYLQFPSPEGLRWILDQAASEIPCGVILAPEHSPESLFWKYLVHQQSCNGTLHVDFPCGASIYDARRK
jgi:hypothetical protein